MALRPVNQVYGSVLRVYAADSLRELLLKEWMLRPLWLQHSIGVKQPKVFIEFGHSRPITNFVRLPPKTLLVSFKENLWIKVEESSDPNYELQLLLLGDSVNG